MINLLTEQQYKRIVGLDIIRCIAILSVVYGHGISFVPKAYQKVYRSFNLQIDGVSLFFVLSGFLIGGILLRTINTTAFNSRDLLNFWIRRWFRTIPTYFLILSFIIAYRLSVGNSTIDFRYFFFTQNFITPHPGFFQEAWSLSIEEWFYILFPLTCFILLKIIKPNKAILLSVGIFITAPLVLRTIKYELGYGIDSFDLEFRKIVVLRLDSLMYGVFAAYILQYKPILWESLKRPLLLLGSLFILALSFNPFDWKNYYMPLYFNIESITALCFLPYLSTLKTTNIRALDSFVIFISVISYSMYLINLTLIHHYLIPITYTIIGDNTLFSINPYVFQYVIFWIYTIVGAYIIYRFYESPITNLRDRIRISKYNRIGLKIYSESSSLSRTNNKVHV